MSNPEAEVKNLTGLLGVVNGFLFGGVGRKVQFGYPNATTETYTLMNGSTTVMVLTAVYTDSTKANLNYVERTS